MSLDHVLTVAEARQKVDRLDRMYLRTREAAHRLKRELKEARRFHRAVSRHKQPVIG